MAASVRRVCFLNLPARSISIIPLRHSCAAEDRGRPTRTLGWRVRRAAAYAGIYARTAEPWFWHRAPSCGWERNWIEADFSFPIRRRALLTMGTTTSSGFHRVSGVWMTSCVTTRLHSHTSRGRYERSSIPPEPPQRRFKVLPNIFTGHLLQFHGLVPGHPIRVEVHPKPRA